MSVLRLFSWSVFPLNLQIEKYPWFYLFISFVHSLICCAFICTRSWKPNLYSLFFNKHLSRAIYLALNYATQILLECFSLSLFSALYFVSLLHGHPPSLSLHNKVQATLKIKSSAKSIKSFQITSVINYLSLIRYPIAFFIYATHNRHYIIPSPWS